MKSILSNLSEIELELGRLLIDVQKLKKLIRALENDKTRLQRELAKSYHVLSDGNLENLVISQENLNSLSQLYNEGYHICNLFFGQNRQGECLFCQAFFAKQNISGLR